MKAIIWTKYGAPDALQPGEVEKPVPRDNEVLIKIHATTVTAGDCELRRLKFPLFLKLPILLYVGIGKPKRIKILGQELAGEIEETGKDVTAFKKGDQVFGATGFGMGAYAEYIRMPESSGEGVLAAKPVSLSYEEAAGVPLGGFESLHFLRQANIRNGQKVLINGAGGSIGTFAVQLAKHFGAEVTAVDSADKLPMLRSIGADHVIDYTEEDFSKRGNTYDVILDVVGKSPYTRSVRSLEKNGYYLLANPKAFSRIRGLWTSITSGKKVVAGTSVRTPEDLVFLGKLVDEGKIMPVVDRSFPLDQTAEAHRYVESGRKIGNVIITM